MKIDQFAIREFKETDINELSTLLLSLHEVHVKLEPAIFKPITLADANAFLSNLVSNSASFCRILIDKQNRLLGYSLSRLKTIKESALLNEQNVLFLDHLFVEKTQRRNKLGTLLIEDLFELARRQGLNEIKTDAWNLNVEATQFFARKGFRKLNTFFNYHLN